MTPVSVGSRPKSSGFGCSGQAPLTFRALIADAESTLVVVARFLALLEMFRDKAVTFDQLLPLAELAVHWTADGRGLVQREPERRIRGTTMTERVSDTSPATGPGRRAGRRGLPGGARAALEAVLMVIDEPATADRTWPPAWT